MVGLVIGRFVAVLPGIPLAVKQSNRPSRPLIDLINHVRQLPQSCCQTMHVWIEMSRNAAGSISLATQLYALFSPMTINECASRAVPITEGVGAALVSSRARPVGCCRHKSRR